MLLSDNGARLLAIHLMPVVLPLVTIVMKQLIVMIIVIVTVLVTWFQSRDFVLPLVASGLALLKPLTSKP
jgi:hypothetical protein